MALLYMESFDYKVAGDTDFASLVDGPIWSQSAYSGASWDPTGGRRNTGCLNCFGQGIANAYGYGQVTFSGGFTTVIIGYAVKYVYHASLLVVPCWGLREAGVDYNFVVYVNASGDITIKDAVGGNTIASAVGAYNISQWAYWEWKVVIDSSSGSIQLRIDGTEVINETGLDTQQGTSGITDTIRFGSPYDGNSWLYAFYDDLVVMDATGSTFNDFIGDVKIDSLPPTADGTHTDFTPSTGTDHYDVINDNRAAGDNEEILAATVGYKDSFDLGSIAADLPSILGVQIVSASNNPDTGIASIRPFLIIGGVQYDADNTHDRQNTIVQGYSSIWENNPATSGAWTKNVLEAMEFGFEFEAAS